MTSVAARVEARVRELIETGTVPPGAALPSERTLGAGRTTVRLALAKLAAKGLLRAEHGRGYIVLRAETTRGRPAAAQDLQPWTIHSSRTLYDTPWVRLDLVDVEPPGTMRFEHHVVRLPRVAIAAVLDEADRVLMLRRYRFVPDRWAWARPTSRPRPTVRRRARSAGSRSRRCRA
jgi:DNA-binding transcriptional MocR family regulator